MSVTDSSGPRNHVYSYDNYDKAGNTTYDGGSNMYAYDAENRLLTVTKTPDALSAACDTSLTLTTGGTGTWIAQSSEHCPDSDNDAVQSPDISDSQNTWIETSVQGAGTLKFWWKVSSQSGDYMTFSIDGQNQSALSGSGGWGEQQMYTVYGSGTHTFHWQYTKDASGSAGDVASIILLHLPCEFALPFKEPPFGTDPSALLLLK